MPNWTRALFVVVAIVAAGGIVLLWRTRHSQPLPTGAATQTSDQAHRPDEAMARDAPPAAPAATRSPMPPELQGNTSPVAPGKPTTHEERVDEILLSENLTEVEKSQRLLQILPMLPETLQPEAAQHVVNLMPDEAYGTLGPLLTNGVAAEPILDVVMADLFSRPNEIKLPMLLSMARAEGHPRAEEAREVLEVYLERDFGPDWAAWERSVEAWLKENPE